MIAEIRLRQFRSYDDQVFTLGKGMNIVVGPNASGKTNLLEGLVVGCLGSSFKANDYQLIKHGCNWSRIDMVDELNKTRTVKIANQNKITKDFIIENKNYKKLSLANRLPVVLFEPNDLLLLIGPPETRRNYLDQILEQIHPNYKKVKSDYLKTLRQRNNLIKKEGSYSELFPWDVRLSHLGGIVALSRSELVNKLDQKITQTYRLLSRDKAQINIDYISSVDIDQYQSRMLKKLAANRELDILRGFTTTGPHREDLGILVNNKPILSVASRGETRSVVVSLKLMEIEIIKQQTNTMPLVLLDDLFSELDADRRAYTTEYLIDHQTVITTTDLENYLNISSKINYIKL